jgi:translation initiation factor eIF-2B subunit delta
MNREPFHRELSKIVEDRDHGARQLARRCLEILAESARSLAVQDSQTLKEQLTDRADRLAKARPSMTPIQNLLTLWRDNLENLPAELDAARRFADQTAQDLIQTSVQAVTEVAQHAAHMLGPGKTVMTHSLSSTLIEVCRVLKDRDLRMIITESRPLCEGRKLAERLSAWQIPTTYITEAQIGLFVGQADAVLVGADSVLVNGDVINKAGTYLLALAAQDQKVPFYACCESFKFRDTEEAPPLEEMSAAELQVPDWPWVTPRNIYFEVIPSRLVHGWITEDGLI